MKRLPTLFLSHGSPLFATENEMTDEYIVSLKRLRWKLPTPKAILSIWAHFYWPYKKIDVSKNPKTLYDFSSFPKELSDIKYEGPGYPEWEKLIQELIPELHYEPITRGFDHGTWTVLMHLFPESTIPVFSMSIDSRDSLEEQFKLWKKLRILREHWILIIANGNIVHDLRTADFDLGKNMPYQFAADFDSTFKEALLNKDYDRLLNPYDMKWGIRSVPTPDHYIPAIITMGTSCPDESVEDIYE